MRRRIEQILLDTQGDEGAEATALDPEAQERLSALGYLSAGSPGSNSGSLLDAGSGSDPKDWIEFYSDHQRLEKLVREQAYDEAAALAKSLLARNPRFAAGHVQLGRIASERGELRSAVEQYERALELDPDNAGVHYNLGNLLRAFGRTDAALLTSVAPPSSTWSFIRRARRSPRRSLRAATPGRRSTCWSVKWQARRGARWHGFDSRQRSRRAGASKRPSNGSRRLAPSTRAPRPRRPCTTGSVSTFESAATTAGLSNSSTAPSPSIRLSHSRTTTAASRSRLSAGTKRRSTLIGKRSTPTPRWRPRTTTSDASSAPGATSNGRSGTSAAPSSWTRGTPRPGTTSVSRFG